MITSCFLLKRGIEWSRKKKYVEDLISKIRENGEFTEEDQVYLKDLNSRYRKLLFSILKSFYEGLCSVLKKKYEAISH